jgi:hypothetical protein
MVALAAACVPASASRVSDQPRRATFLTALLTPGEVTSKPTGVPSGARGTLRATFWPFRDGWVEARFALSTRRLTGSVQGVHVHTGTPGRDGPVLLELCGAGRYNLYGGFRAYPAGIVRTIRVLGGYVDVHTKRNPRGELRGQIEIRRTAP